MRDRLSRLESELDEILREVDPETLHAADAEQLYEHAARIEAKAGSLRVLCAGRAAQGDSWRRQGFRSAAHYLAARTGAPVREAADAVATSGRLDWLPDVEDALRAGQLTPARTKVVAEAAEDHPGSQGALLEAARAKDFSELEVDCRRTRALASSRRSEAERERRIRARRHFWHRTGADGSFRFGGETTTADGARMLAAVEAREHEVFDRVRSEDRREPPGAYALDALVELVTEARSGAGPRGDSATVSVLVSEETLRRGWRQGQEVCEVPGVGPVSVATVEQLVGDARLELVVHSRVKPISAARLLTLAAPCHVRFAPLWRNGTRCVSCPTAMPAAISRSTTGRSRSPRIDAPPSTGPAETAPIITTSGRTRVGTWSVGPGNGGSFPRTSPTIAIRSGRPTGGQWLRGPTCRPRSTEETPTGARDCPVPANGSVGVGTGRACTRDRPRERSPGGQRAGSAEPVRGDDEPVVAAAPGGGVGQASLRFAP